MVAKLLQYAGGSNKTSPRAPSLIDTPASEWSLYSASSVGCLHTGQLAIAATSRIRNGKSKIQSRNAILLPRRLPR